MRIFNNINNLYKQTIYARIGALDNYAVVTTYDGPLTDANLYVIGTAHYCGVDSTLPDATITTALSTVATPSELSDLVDYFASRAAFMQLPNWASWTPQQGADYVNANILSGMTQVQIDAYINTTATTLPGVVTVLHQIGIALVTTRTVLAGIAMAVLYIRNLVIKFRE
jgi:hypothetical protein